MRRRPFPGTLPFPVGKLGCEVIEWCFSAVEIQRPVSSFGGVKKQLCRRQQLNPIFQRSHTGFLSAAVVVVLGVGSWTQLSWKQFFRGGVLEAPWKYFRSFLKTSSKPAPPALPTILQASSIYIKPLLFPILTLNLNIKYILFLVQIFKLHLIIYWRRCTTKKNTTSKCSLEKESTMGRETRFQGDGGGRKPHVLQFIFYAPFKICTVCMLCMYGHGPL